VEEVTLLDILIVLAKHKKLIAQITIGATLLALVISFVIPKKFTATTRILPPQQTQSSAIAMLAQLNPLAAGLGRDLGLKNPSDLFVTMLKSRTVEDALIDKFDLRREYDYKTYYDTRKKLESRSSISSDKDGTIAVSVEDGDPQRSADMANAYVDELYKLTQTLAVTEASQRRLFFQRQLDMAKQDLAEAEASLRQTQEKTGIIQLDGQAKAIIESTAELKAQIAAREVQLQRMKLFATDQNPEYQGLQQELSGLRAQLARAEQTRTGGNGEIQIATAKIPEAGLEYVRRYRDVKYYETIFEVLAKQYEAAKLDEAKNAAIIQVMDKAVPPEKKSSPKRTVIVLITLLATTLLSCSWAFLLEYYQRMQQDPFTSARMSLLRKTLSRS
jgi:uncharacterized protein involved in exopolysaccharide biosynthesis